MQFRCFRRVGSRLDRFVRSNDKTDCSGTGLSKAPEPRSRWTPSINLRTRNAPHKPRFRLHGGQGIRSQVRESAVDLAGRYPGKPLCRCYGSGNARTEVGSQYVSVEGTQRANSVGCPAGAVILQSASPLVRGVSWEVGQPENLASTPSEVSQLPVPGSL